MDLNNSYSESYWHELLEKYLKGSIGKQELHLLEKRALDDPFLFEAMQGLEGDEKALQSIQMLRKKILTKSINKKRVIYYLLPAAAACMLLVFAVTNYFKSETDLQKNQVEETFTMDISNDENIELTEQTSENQGPSIQFTEELQRADIEPQTTASALKQEDLRNKKISRMRLAPKKNEKPPSFDTKSNESEAKIREGEDLEQTIVENEMKEALSEQYVRTSNLSQIDDGASSFAKRAKTLQEESIQLQESAVSNERIAANTNVFPIIGFQAYEEYIDKNNSVKVNGEVIVEFSIDSEGNLDNFKIIKSLCEECDKEAIRLIKEGPSWKTIIAKEKVTGRYSIKFEE